MTAAMFPTSPQIICEVGQVDFELSRSMVWTRLQALRSSYLNDMMELYDLLTSKHFYESWTSNLSQQPARVVYAVVVSAVSLLSFVYQYLIGHVGNGGTLTCSTGSFQFRATFISIVLFEGAYVWIKFRDVAAPTAGGYRRPVVKDELTGAIIKFSKPEAKYTPPGQSGNSLYLGRCATDEEARIKKHIAAFYYGREEGTLDLGHGHRFQIPSVQTEQERNLSVKEKRIWVKGKVKEVYESFEKQQKAILSASHPPSEVDAGGFCTFLEKFLLESPSDTTFGTQPQQRHVQENQVQASGIGVPTFDNQVNPSHLESNGSVEKFPIPSEVAFDNDIGSEDVQVFSLKTFPDIVAQPQQPSESAQAQGPATGTLTSGDPVNASTVDGNAQHSDSEASKLLTVSSDAHQRSDAEEILMGMNTELQQKVLDTEQRLQECLRTNEALKQTNEVLKQMLEARDKRNSELELENLCLKRTKK